MLGIGWARLVKAALCCSQGAIQNRAPYADECDPSTPSSSKPPSSIIRTSGYHRHPGLELSMWGPLLHLRVPHRSRAAPSLNRCFSNVGRCRRAHGLIGLPSVSIWWARR